MSKTKQTLSPARRDAFLKLAKALKVTIGDNVKVADPREFDSGSVGYNANGEIVLDIDGEPMRFQLSMNLVAKGSKTEKKAA